MGWSSRLSSALDRKSRYDPFRVSNKAHVVRAGGKAAHIQSCCRRVHGLPVYLPSVSIVNEQQTNAGFGGKGYAHLVTCRIGCEQQMYFSKCPGGSCRIQGHRFLTTALGTAHAIPIALCAIARIVVLVSNETAIRWVLGLDRAESTEQKDTKADVS